jgi:hypothetical protein
LQTAEAQSTPAQKRAAINFGVEIVEAICRECARSNQPLQASIGGSDPRLTEIVQSRDTPAAFDWMMESFNYQGISDGVAGAYLEAHGSATWEQIKSQIARDPRCDLLQSYWQFEGCHYDKTRHTCANPSRFRTCPLPTYPLRNGRLNQTAFSFFLFVRDVAQSDLFSWIDAQLSDVDAGYPSDQEALIGPMRHIFGISDKVLTMTLSSLLMANRENRPAWFKTGSEMIVVDRLVHNFLVRTGTLAAFGADHPYGHGCYGKAGCADILRHVSREIDARQFDPAYPANFPRYTQHALWRYCAANALNICNGNNIDDRSSCTNLDCPIFRKCRKIPLKPGIF